jgi:hypothetical protein
MRIGDRQRSVEPLHLTEPCHSVSARWPVRCPDDSTGVQHRIVAHRVGPDTTTAYAESPLEGGWRIGTVCPGLHWGYATGVSQHGPRHVYSSRVIADHELCFARNTVLAHSRAGTGSLIEPTVSL